jgi:hypothetical protein
MTDEYDVQQRLAQFVERETEYWDFWGAIRIVKNDRIFWETSRGYSCAEFGVKNTLAIISRRCFCSAQGLIKDGTFTERSGSLRPVRLCAT